MKYLIFSLIAVLLLLFAYMQLSTPAVTPVNPRASEKQSGPTAVLSDSGQMPVTYSLPADPKSTMSADAVSEVAAVNEYADPHTQQINDAYDALDAKINQLFEQVDIDTLDLGECRYLLEKAWDMERDSELSVLLGDDTISFKNYRDYDLEYLQELALLNDLAAQKMLGFKLMRSLQTLDEGIYWSKVAAARGSKHAIVHIIEAHMNDLSISPGSEETKKAPDFEEKYEVYVALSQYRAGFPRYLPSERGKYEDDAIAQQYFALLEEILTLRQSYELPGFVNRTSASIPDNIGNRCNEIETENPQPWSVFVDH